MKAPGLTCFQCEQAIYPAPAKATDWGWMHANGCPQTCDVTDCDQPRRKRQWCELHYKRWLRNGTVVDIDGRIEDLEWMAETGESLDGAAARLGMTPKALEKFLGRHKRTDIRARLVARQPRDHNKVTDGNPVTRLTASPADRERQKRRTATQRARRQEKKEEAA